MICISEVIDISPREVHGQAKWRVTANGRRVSLKGEENVIKLILVMEAKL